ncbi:MAG: hypothetical protein M3O22_08890 [Pseudomonadota bacterium]|nr:hypothetical protein [Pseudomonadota bacterium]
MGRNSSGCVRGRVSGNQFVVTVCHEGTSRTLVFNIGWSRLLDMELRDDGSHWILSASVRETGSAPETVEIARFRDRKAAEKIFCRLSCALRCPGPSTGRMALRMAAIAAATSLSALAVIFVLLAAFVMVVPVQPLPMQIPPAPAAESGMTGSDALNQALIQQMLREQTGGMALPPGTLPGTPQPAAPPPQPVGVPMSADDILGSPQQ